MRSRALLKSNRRSTRSIQRSIHILPPRRSSSIGPPDCLFCHFISHLSLHISHCSLRTSNNFHIHLTPSMIEKERAEDLPSHQTPPILLLLHNHLLRWPLLILHRWALVVSLWGVTALLGRIAVTAARRVLALMVLSRPPSLCLRRRGGGEGGKRSIPLLRVLRAATTTTTAAVVALIRHRGALEMIFCVGFTH